MTRMLAEKTTNTDARKLKLDLTKAQKAVLPAVFSAFVDASATATGRGSFYNTEVEQEAALAQIHTDLLAVDRGVYALSLLLPGWTDHARLYGVERLLGTARADSESIDPRLEREIVRRLCSLAPPQRVLKRFLKVRAAKVNNSRTRKLMLGWILGSRRLELWAVKYRRKLAAVLEHAWGQRLTRALRTILSKERAAWSPRERRLVASCVHRYARVPAAVAEECVAFVLGAERTFTLTRLCAYQDAKRDITQGHLLPYEVLEGIRSRYHASTSSKTVLQLTRQQLTSGQRLALQRKSRDAGVKVELDLEEYDAVRLYVYAFEMGMNDEIRRALKVRAQEVAARLHIRFGRAALVLDASSSMFGHESQKLRPMATALAIRDVLCAAADETLLITNDGRPAPAGELLAPRGDTALGSALVYALEYAPEIVFVISDGYENAPAGRTAEVLHAARRLGVATPVQHLSPVLAAESRLRGGAGASGMRDLLGAGRVTPVSQPDALAVGLLKAAFEVDTERAVELLWSLAAPQLEALEHAE